MWFVRVLAVGWLLGGCSQPELETKVLTTAPSAGGAPVGGGRGGALPVAMDCSAARRTIQSQYEAIKVKLPADVFRVCFTDRQKHKITDEMLARAREEIAKMSFDEVFASEVPEGDAAVKVMMQNGRTLTTVVKEGDMWKADTLWFK